MWTAKRQAARKNRIVPVTTTTSHRQSTIMVRLIERQIGQTTVATTVQASRPAVTSHTQTGSFGTLARSNACQSLLFMLVAIGSISL